VVSLDFSVTYSFRPYHGLGVDSDPSQNEYQEHFLEVKAAGAWGLQPHHLHVPNVMKSGSLNSWNPLGTCTGLQKNYVMEPAFQFHADRIPCTMLAVSVSWLFASRCSLRRIPLMPSQSMWVLYLHMTHEIHLFYNLFSESNNIGNDNKQRWVCFECFFYFLGWLCKTEGERR
jgi:hypothetical protein